jgi:hypothetical protein
MSIGNLKTQGGKGTNWPWQYKMLKGLQGIIDVISSTANGSEYEAKLVNITCTGVPFNGTELYLEVRVWDTVTGGFTGNPTYYLPGSTVGVPLATFTDEGCTIEYLEAGDATEATLQDILDELELIEAGTAAALGQTTMIDSVPVVIANDQEGIAVTPTLDRVAVNTDSPIVAGARSVSIANVGTEDGLVLGTVLSAGETITFDAGSINNTLGAITYDPTTPGATTFLIATLT